MGEIGIHHHRIGGYMLPPGLEANGALASKGDAIDRGVKAELHPQALRHAGHRLRHPAQAAANMENAMLIFQKTENGEQRRAFERAHAQIFGLK